MSVTIRVTMIRALENEVTEDLAVHLLTERGRLELQEKLRKVYKFDDMLVTVARVEDYDAAHLP